MVVKLLSVNKACNGSIHREGQEISSQGVQKKKMFGKKEKVKYGKIFDLKNERPEKAKKKIKSLTLNEGTD